MEAKLELGEELRALLLGASATHDGPSPEACALAWRRLGVPPGGELVGREGLGVSRVGVEHQQERCSSLDDPHASMGVSVNAAFVSLRKAEGALEVEVIQW